MVGQNQTPTISRKKDMFGDYRPSRASDRHPIGVIGNFDFNNKSGRLCLLLLEEVHKLIIAKMVS
jgi:hypothetical protein